MMLKRLSPDSEIEVLTMTESERRVVLKMEVLAAMLAEVGYPGASETVAWLQRLARDAGAEVQPS